jgi:hypothetical protein
MNGKLLNKLRLNKNYMNENYNKICQDIVSKCKFVSKKDEWFVEGCVCKNEYAGGSYSEYKFGDKFNSGWSLFRGLTMNGVIGNLPADDGETCPFDEFYMYDEYNNEISELTLDEYLKLLTVS